MTDLIVREQDGILWASINRPTRGSSISRAVADGYVAATRRLAEEPDLKGLIWMSESETLFSGGVDLKTPEGMTEADAGKWRVGIVTDLIGATLTCQRPIVVLARGKMLGGAFLNALLADRILADESATFRLPEVSIGIASPFAAAIVEAATHRGLAYDLCLSARAIPAREFEQKGGPCTTLPAADLRQGAIDAIEAYAAMPPEAFGYMKRWFQTSRSAALEAAMRYAEATRKP